MARIIPAPAELIVAPGAISAANGKTIAARAALDVYVATNDVTPGKLRAVIATNDLPLAATGAAPATIVAAPEKLRVTPATIDLHPAVTVLPAATIAASLPADAAAMTRNAVPVSTFGARAVLAGGGLNHEIAGAQPAGIPVASAANFPFD